MNRIVTPGIEPDIMHSLWHEAIDYAEAHPGETVSILFMPGNYPMPDPGVYEYNPEPTLVHVSSPGLEMRFMCQPTTRKMVIETVGKKVA